MALDRGRALLQPARNQHDREKAKQLLREAGYKGEPVRFLSTKDYAWMYNYALVTKQQLEELGMVIDLQMADYYNVWLEK